jgi:branched-subunit amino acid transport protein
MNESALWSLLAILGLGVVTVLTRSFFFIFHSEWGLPPWIERGLRYAPIAALAAVVIPEILSTQGQWSAWWVDARFYAALASLAYFAWKRHVLGSILLGTAVYLGLHVGWGW